MKEGDPGMETGGSFAILPANGTGGAYYADGGIR